MIPIYVLAWLSERTYVGKMCELACELLVPAGGVSGGGLGCLEETNLHCSTMR